MDDPEPLIEVSDDAPPRLGTLGLVKLAAIHVYVIKLLAATPPLSMPKDFADALATLRLIERDG